MNEKQDDFDILEPMQPGEDAPSSRPPEPDMRPEEVAERIAALYLADAADQHRRTKQNAPENITEYLGCMAVFAALLLLIMETPLPDFLMAAAALCPLAAGIYLRVKRDGMTVREALPYCKAHALLSGCYLMLGLFLWLG